MEIESHYPIETQTSHLDKISLFLIMEAMVFFRETYNYFEIGNFKGGTLYPHIKNPKCKHIYALDKREIIQKDNRGINYHYLNNNEKAMGKILEAYCTEEEMAKVEMFKGESVDLAATLGLIRHIKPDLCFIDAEHTDLKACLDFNLCFDELLKRKPGVIVFHDFNLIYNALAHITLELKRQNMPFNAYYLPDNIFVMEFGINLHRYPPLAEFMFERSYEGLLYTMKTFNHYQRFYNWAPFRWVRNIWNLITLKSVFKV